MGNMMGLGFRDRLRLVISAWVTGVAHVRREWWKRPPFLPMPSARHLRWRRMAAYGSDLPAPRRDVLAFLRWADRHRKATT